MGGSKIAKIVGPTFDQDDGKPLEHVSTQTSLDDASICIESTSGLPRTRPSAGPSIGILEEIVVLSLARACWCPQPWIIPRD
jgi:hypothetical protein